MDIGTAIVERAKRLPVTVDLSTIEVGDMIRFLALTRSNSSKAVRKVIAVDLERRTVIVEFQGCVDFAVFTGEIIEIIKEARECSTP